LDIETFITRWSEARGGAERESSAVQTLANSCQYDGSEAKCA
jgi:hypothetical protein